jgi:hypothetical protein
MGCVVGRAFLHPPLLFYLPFAPPYRVFLGGVGDLMQSVSRAPAGPKMTRHRLPKSSTRPKLPVVYLCQVLNPDRGGEGKIAGGGGVKKHALCTGRAGGFGATFYPPA